MVRSFRRTTKLSTILFPNSSSVQRFKTHRRSLRYAMDRAIHLLASTSFWYENNASAPRTEDVYVYIRRKIHVVIAIRIFDRRHLHLYRRVYQAHDL